MHDLVRLISEIDEDSYDESDSGNYCFNSQATRGQGTLSVDSSLFSRPLEILVVCAATGLVQDQTVTKLLRYLQ